jgi:hypothetical protein
VNYYRPLRFARNCIKRVSSGFQSVAFDWNILRKGQFRRGIGTRSPNFSERNQLTKNLPTFRARSGIT